jgi:hypothetical protein
MSGTSTISRAKTGGVVLSARGMTCEPSGILMGAPSTVELKTKVAMKRVEAEEIIVEQTAIR